MSIRVLSYDPVGQLNRQFVEVPNQLGDLDGTLPASDVSYDNSQTGLRATNAQEALDQLAGIPGEPQNFYVDVVNGSDTTGDGTQANPYQTYQKAVRVLPMGWKGITKIICAPGTYDLTPDLNDGQARPLWMNNSGGWEGFPLQTEGSLTDALGTRTMTATDASEMNVADGTLAMVPNEFVGAFLSIVSGPNAGARVMIASNTATAFRVNMALPPGTSLAGTQFVVGRPAVTFLYDENGPFFATSAILFRGVKFAPKFPGTGASFGIGGVFNFMESCEIELGFNDSTFFEGRSARPIRGAGIPVLRYPAGCHIHGPVGGFALFNMDADAHFINNCVLQNLVVFMSGGAMDLDSPVIYDTTVICANNSLFTIDSNNPVGVGTFWLRAVPLFFGPLAPALLVLNSSAATLDNIDISGTNVLAAVSAGSSDVGLGLVTGTTALVGLIVGKGSQLGIDLPAAFFGSGLTSVAGASGQLVVNGVFTLYLQVRATPAAWAPLTPYLVVGQRVTVAAAVFPPIDIVWYFEVVVAGTSGAAPPLAPVNPGGFFPDGTVVWQNIGGSLGNTPPIPPGVLVGNAGVSVTGLVP